MALIRDYTDSELVNLLSDKAEILFARLLTKADGNGNYYADPVLIKSNCFPRKDYRTAQIRTWLKELAAEHQLSPSTQPTSLLRMYESSGKQYLHILRYGQTLKYKSSKFPLPDFLNHDPPEEKRREVKRREVEIEVEVREKGSRAQIFEKLFKEIIKQGRKYYPLESKRCEQEILKLQNAATWTKEEDEKIFNRLIGNEIRSEIDKMLNWYHKDSRHEKITDWSAAMFSWLDRRKDFKKQPA